jgi:hypothetical protein
MENNSVEQCTELDTLPAASSFATTTHVSITILADNIDRPFGT